MRAGENTPPPGLVCSAQQQPQSSSQPLFRLLPQPLLPQPQPQLLLPQLLLLQPPQQQKRIISRIIHQEPLPPQPLFPQHILHFTSFHLHRDRCPRASVPFYGPGLSLVTELEQKIIRS